MIVTAVKTDGNHRYNSMRNKRSPLESRTRPLTLPLQYGQLMPKYGVRCLQWLFDLNGEANRAKQRQNRAIMVAEVRRFGHVINTDRVVGAHNSPAQTKGRALNARPYKRGVRLR